MSRNAIRIASVSILVCLINTAHATIWYVHPDSALSSIQAGIDSSATGDTVLVGPGTYVENLFWPNTMGIDLFSEYGPDTTIIDGGNPSHPDSGSVVLFATYVDTSTVLRGFTIRNGTGTDFPPYDRWGGGIYCVNSSPAIIGNIIDSNTATWGGGIACYDNAQALIDSNIITANTADSSGGGILSSFSQPYICGNTIGLNNAHYGAGIYVCYPSYPLIANNIIEDNYAAEIGGGICITFYTSPTVRDNIITANTAGSYAGAVYCGGDCSSQFTGNTITANSGEWGLLSVYGAITTLRSSNISDNENGVWCFNGTIILDSCTISNNQSYGVLCGDNADVLINYCNIYGHTTFGVSNESSVDTVNAEYNWWGDPSGPSGFGPGTGDAVSDIVDFTPWLQDSVEWVGIEENEELTIHETRFGLHVYPNPFSALTNIDFSHVQCAKNIELRIYDAAGRLVKDFHTTLNALHPTQMSWDGTDFANRRLPSGVYFLNLNAGVYATTQKLLLIR